MSRKQLTVFIEDWQEPFYNGPDGSDLSELLLYTNAQRAMMTAIKELHALTDGVLCYRSTDSAPPEIFTTELPSLMIQAMESRERAKRLYRSALMTKISDSSWDMEKLFEELNEELFRSAGVLRLYQKRGSYY